VNDSQQPVTLISATVIPVPGYKSGVQDHFGVGASLGSVGIGINWPPAVPVKGLQGVSLPHGESRIIFGIAGTQVGAAYAAAGIRITYRYQGRDYTMTAWAGLMGCITQPGRQRQAGNSPSCTVPGDRLTAAVQKVARAS
jgi:hypothetical protein